MHAKARFMPAAASLMLPLAGCVLTRSTTYWPSDQTVVETGARVTLSEEVTDGWRGRISRVVGLEVEGRGTLHRVDVTQRDDTYYELRGVEGTDRVFVVAHPSNQVIVSMDLATGQTWDDPAHQPEWAVVNGEKVSG